MIQFQKVSKFYNKDIVALKDICFDVDSGEFIFLVGPSGAGKSTLIRLLIREELPTEGDILFDEINVNQLARKLLPVYRQQIGVVFQDFKLLETKTIQENIEFALEITGKDNQEIKETTEYLLEVVRLNDRSELFPPQLSGGEKQRAGIARALANDPMLLIADEPTGNLDPDTSNEIMEILQKINSWGTTIMIATHDKETVDRLQKRVIRLEQGEIVSDHVGSYDSTKRSSTKQQPKIKKTKPTSQEPKKSKPKQIKKSEVEDTSIKELNLPKKIKKVLKKNNLNTIAEILDLSEEELQNIKGIGEKNAVTILNQIQNLITNAARKETSK